MECDMTKVIKYTLISARVLVRVLVLDLSTFKCTWPHAGSIVITTAVCMCSQCSYYTELMSYV